MQLILLVNSWTSVSDVIVNVTRDDDGSQSRDSLLRDTKSRDSQSLPLALRQALDGTDTHTHTHTTLILSLRPLVRNERILWTRSSAMAEDRETRLSDRKKRMQSMNDLDIHPRSSQLLLINGRTTYHFMFVDCFHNIFI